MIFSKMIHWFLLIIACVVLFNYIMLDFVFYERLGTTLLVVSVIFCGLLDFFAGCLIGVFCSFVLYCMAAEDSISGMISRIIQKMRPTFCLAIFAITVLASSFSIVSAENSFSQVKVMLANSLVAFACGLFFVAQYLVKKSCQDASRFKSNFQEKI